jgi:hypothetical protein
MTPTEFRSLVEQHLPDNTQGLITPADLRHLLLLLIAVLADGGFDPDES